MRQGKNNITLDYLKDAYGAYTAIVEQSSHQPTKALIYSLYKSVFVFLRPLKFNLVGSVVFLSNSRNKSTQSAQKYHIIICPANPNLHYYITVEQWRIHHDKTIIP